MSGWKVKFDFLPVGCDDMIVTVKHDKLTTLRPGDDEPPLDPKLAAAQKEDDAMEAEAGSEEHKNNQEVSSEQKPKSLLT
jgi:hypothetical protein